MSSVCLRLAFAVLLLPAAGEARTIRVCADPNNLPFSNERGEGFENRIVEIIAGDLGAEVSYTWWAQRRGFVRNTIKDDLCDLLPGVPPHFQGLRTTPPYYSSTYAFVTRAGEAPVASFSDPRLRTLRVGVQLVGDDGVNTPPAHELAARGIVQNVRGYSLYGDYSRPNPPARIMAAVAAGDIDVAIAWGPLAGYFANRETVPLTVTPVEPRGGASGLPMAFSIALGLRKGDALAEEIDAALQRNAADIEALLASYGVPRVAPELVAADEEDDD